MSRAQVVLNAAVIAVALFAVAVERSANAQDWSIHGVGSAANGWTDNILNEPDESDPDADFFSVLSPGALFTFESPRTAHVVNYTLNLTVYAEHSEANSFRNQLGWQGVIDTSPRTQLFFNAQVANGQINNFATDTVGEVGLTPGGSSDFASGSLGEGFTWELSPAWRLSQGFSVQVLQTSFESNTQTDTRDLGATAGIEYNWKDDGVRLGLGANLITLERPDPVMMMQLTQDQRNLSADLTWTHNISQSWSSRLGAGVIRTEAPDTEFGATNRPTVGAGLFYQPPWGALRLSAARTLTTQLLVARTTASDNFVFDMWLPLRQMPGAYIAAGAALTWSRFSILELETGTESDPINAYSGSAAVSYNRGEGLRATLAYQYTQQEADQTFDALQGYERHTVLLIVSGRYPVRQAAQLRVQDTLRVNDELEDENGEPQRRGRSPLR